MSFSTAIVNLPAAAPVTVSPSSSVAVMIEEKSIEGAWVLPSSSCAQLGARVATARHVIKLIVKIERPRAVCVHRQGENHAVADLEARSADLLDICRQRIAAHRVRT